MLWEQGRASTGDIVLVCSLGFTILHASRDLAVALVGMTQHVVRLGEALATLLVPHEMPDAPGARLLRGLGGRVEFRGVRFAYPGGRPVLRGLDLHIPAGQRIGADRPVRRRQDHGAGAAAALRPAAGRPHSGRWPGHRRCDAGQPGASIAMVPQDVPLLHRSVLENVRYGRPDATEAEVLAVARRPAAGTSSRRCRRAPTPVGDRGAKLSGGQRQRLAIARALLKDAPILLLDEATSALDSEWEAEVQRALDRLMQGRTVIAVAHRLATLGGFDRIVVMQDGQVMEDGPPNLLARQPGLYRELLERQSCGLEIA